MVLDWIWMLIYPPLSDFTGLMIWQFFTTFLPPVKGQSCTDLTHLITCSGKKSCHIPNLAAVKSQTTLATTLCLWRALEGAVSNSSLKILFRTAPGCSPRKTFMLAANKMKIRRDLKSLTVFLRSVVFWAGFILRRRSNWALKYQGCGHFVTFEGSNMILC